MSLRDEIPTANPAMAYSINQFAHDEIARKTAEFLARKGKIEVVPIGASKDITVFSNQVKAKYAECNKRGVKKAKQVNKKWAAKNSAEAREAMAVKASKQNNKGGMQ